MFGILYRQEGNEGNMRTPGLMTHFKHECSNLFDTFLSYLANEQVFPLRCCIPTLEIFRMTQSCIMDKNISPQQLHITFHKQPLRC